MNPTPHAGPAARRPTIGIDPALPRARASVLQRPSASQLIGALELCWTAIQARQPDVPDAVIVIGAESARQCRGRLGAVAASRWDSTGHPPLAEIVIAREGLARDSHHVLATLLHEAAHGTAHARQIQDTSRQGRYHNRHFKTIGEDVGLSVEQQATRGWALTTLTNGARASYRQELAALERALQAHPHHPPSPPPRRNGANNLACRCPCGRVIRVAAGTLAQGAIACSNCQQPFTPDHPTSPPLARP